MSASTFDPVAPKSLNAYQYVITYLFFQLPIVVVKERMSHKGGQK